METISHFRYLNYDDTYKAGSDANILNFWWIIFAYKETAVYSCDVRVRRRIFWFKEDYIKKGADEICIMRGLTVFVPHKGDQQNEVNMGCICNMHGTDQKCIKNSDQS